ncbi:tyrosine-type recombinase/integrase [Microtetraspora fusca]|uniref:Tyrosine-type recombinase/integrase n=1 Tax=Microtetraspora fusca TaxID=1997 RepID=A0ABW6VJH7_MICFU
MASIEERISKAGTKSWRVAWREGGTRSGTRDGETCYDRRTAKRFKGLVEANGDRRPEGYPKGCHGMGTGERPAPQAEPTDSAPAVPTLTAVVEAYLAQNMKADARQIADYRRLYVNHVQAAIVTLPDGRRVGPLGGLPVDELDGDTIQAWVNWMRGRTYAYRGQKRHYSPKTIHNVHGAVIAPALAYALRKGLITADPCADVQLPQKPARTVSLDQVPTGEEIQQWIAIAYKASLLAGDIVSIAMGTGLRWAEITALRPCDIDLERRLLTVAGAIKEDDKSRRLYRAEYGKSATALRTIRIPASLIMVFARRTRGLDRKALIFRGARGGILSSSSWSHIHWKKVMKLAQEQATVETDPTLHKFRHAHATSLLAANVSLDTVSKRLGHKSITVTSNLYSHLSPEADQRAVDVVDQVMTGKPQTA